MAPKAFLTFFRRSLDLVVLGLFVFSSLFLSLDWPLSAQAQYGCGEYGSNYSGYGNDCAVPIDETNIDEAFSSFACDPGSGAGNVALITKPSTCTGELNDGYLPPESPDFIELKIEGTSDATATTCTFPASDTISCANLDVGTIPGGRKLQYGFNGAGSLVDLQVNGGNVVIQVQPAISFYRAANETTPFTTSGETISVDENGGSSPIFYKLNRTPQPGQNVSFNGVTDGVEIQFGGGAEVTKTISNTNWTNTNASFGVKAIDDDVAEDNPHSSDVTFTNLSSSDPLFDDIPVQVYPGGVATDLVITAEIIDNDSAALVIEGVSNNAISMPENNAQESFTFELNSAPATGTQVKVDITHTGNSGTIDAGTSTYTFTDADWDDPRTVTLNSVNDNFDRNDTGTINLTVDDAATTDDEYDGLSQAIAVTYEDDDTAGFEFNFDETNVEQDVLEGQNTKYTVVLTSQPTNNEQVVIEAQAGAPSGDDFLTINSQSTQTGTAVTVFTESDWNQPKNVTLVGVEDAALDNHETTVTHSVRSEPNLASEYAQLVANNYSKQVEVNVFDNDTAGLKIEQTDSSTDVSEDDLNQIDSYTVALNTQPTDDVDVTVTPDADQVLRDPLAGPNFLNPEEALTLTFTSANYNTPRVIEVRANDDPTVEGAHQGIITHTTSTSTTDTNYQNLTQALSVNVTDNDNPGMVIELTDPNDTEVDESGAGNTISYNVSLAAQPQSDVYLMTANISPDRLVVDSPAAQQSNGNNYRLLFKSDPNDPLGWNKPQTVVLRAIDNEVDQNLSGRTTYRVVDALSDPLFRPVPNVPVDTPIVNDDTTGIVLTDDQDASITDLALAEGEAGKTVRVKLNSRPRNDATVTLTIAGAQVSLNDLGEGNDATLVFAAADWNTPQDLVIQAIDDNVDEADPHETNVTFDASSTDTKYQNLNVSPLEVDITDNDGAGLLFSAPANGNVDPFVIPEGASRDFLFALASEPSAQVQVAFSSNNTAEAQLSHPDFNPTDGKKLTFNATNWDVPQAVTLINTEDDRDVEEESALITATVTTGSAPEYLALDDKTMDVEITDNDTAALTVVTTAGSTTVSEDGTDSDIYRLRLEADALDEVRVNLALPANPRFRLQQNDVDVSQVVFPAGSLKGQAQTLTVVGIDDNIDNPQESMDYSVQHTVEVPSNTDNPYHQVGVSDATISVEDNDTAEVVVRRKDGSPAQLREDSPNQTVVFEIFLRTDPTAEVRIDEISIPQTAEDEATFDPQGAQQTVFAQNLVLTTTPQEITLYGLDDPVDDGPQQVELVTSGLTSTDTKYGALTAEDTPNVTFANIDDDVTSISVARPDQCPVRDNGSAGCEFTFELGAQPADPNHTVSLPLSFSEAGEATFGAFGTDIQNTTIELTYGTPTRITVYGIRDNVIDGNKVVTLITEDPTSPDSLYDGLDENNVQDRAFSVIDTNTAEVQIAGGPFITNESGTTTKVFFQLRSQPTDPVTIPVAVADTSEGDLGGVENVVIQPENWNKPGQNSVTVTGVDDNEQDGNIEYELLTGETSSNDSNYNGISAEDTPNATIRNNDLDQAAINVTKRVDTGVNGNTNEGGESLVFEISLATDPGSSVTLPLTLDDASEASFDESSSNVATSVTVTYPNVETVTVYGVDDLLVDGNRPVTLQTGDATSANSAYDDLDAGDTADVIFANEDNDQAGFIFPPQDPGNPNFGTVYGSSVSVGEGSTQNALPVRLDGQPSGSVTVQVTANDELSVSSVELTFDENNWDEPQLITFDALEDVTMQDDPGSLTLEVTDGTASEYAGTTQDVAVTVLNNDGAGVTTTKTAGDSTSEDQTKQIEYSFALDRNPETDVELALTLDPAGEASFSQNEEVLTTTVTATYENPATVTIYGQADNFKDGDQTVTLTGEASSENAAYDQLQNAVSEQFMNLDNDDVVIVTPLEDPDDPDDGTVSGNDITVGEGESETYPVELSSRPSANVVLTLTQGQGLAVSPSELTFTPENWNKRQLVTLTAAENKLLGNQETSFDIVVDSTRSQNSGYENTSQAVVEVTITDNDTAGYILVESDNKTEVKEGETADTYELSLTAQPNQPVSIEVASTPDVEVTPSTVTFTTGANSNWNEPQLITVQAVDDDLIEETEQANLVHTVTTDDPDYSPMAITDVTVSVEDNETAEVELVPTGGVNGADLGILEGQTESFTLSLTGEPTAKVVFDITSSSLEEATPSPTRVEILPSEWAQGKVVSVQNTEDDIIADDTASLAITVDDTQSAAEYAGVSESLDIVIVDNDTANIVTTPITSTTSEDQTDVAEIHFALTSQPSQPVTLTLNVTDETEGVLTNSELTIEPTNWNQPSNNVVLVEGVNDNEVDGDVSYELEVTGVTSEDTDYDALDETTVPPLVLENLDDDTNKPTLVITYLGNAQGNTIGQTSELGTKAVAQFELEKEPLDGESVTILFESTDETEGTTSVEELVITGENWDQSTLNQVEITGVDDFVADGDIAYALNLLDVTSSDAGYEVIEDEDLLDLDLLNLDNDTRGIEVEPGSLTLEEGQTGQFSVRLFSEPTEDVELKFTYDETRVKLVSVPAPGNAATQALFDFTPVRLQESVDSFFFNSSNWQETKYFEVTAVENRDYVGDDLQETLEIELVTIGDYADEVVPNVTVTIRDNDPQPTATPRTGGVDNRVWFTLLTVLLAVIIAAYIYRRTTQKTEE